jgi:hypothetical protein
MPEGNINAEVAEHLREHDEHEGGHSPSRRRIETVEILEAIILSIVALVTALSGYQSARWDGESAKAYATSSRLRSESVQTQLTANQYLAFDANTFTAWLQAHYARDLQLQRALSSRFTPPFKSAFDAWLKLDPFHDPTAPAGPAAMPQYKDPMAALAKAQGAAATAAFDNGAQFRDRGEHYVRLTIILAAVLFLIALGQRFKIRGVRYAVNIVAGVFLIYCVFLVITYPHA